MHGLIPSQEFALWLLGIIRDVFSGLHINASASLQSTVYLIAVVGIAVLSGWIVQSIITIIVQRIVAVRFAKANTLLEQHKVLAKCGRIIPPMVLLSLIPFALNDTHPTTHIVITVTVIYSIIVTVMAINSILSCTWLYYNSYHNDKNLPLRGILDITKGAMWIVAVIVIISMLIDKSPLALLTGLGAFAAVLLLVFKNSILGLVAGVELSDNDMLRVGDWISVPGTDTNGIVEDVSLVVVKVRNWNNTVSMLPAYSLVSSTFINWRYMKQSGSRQIEMSVPIDINTVRPPSDTDLAEIQAKVPALKDFITVKLKQRAEGKTANVYNKEAGVDGSIDTNLGLLRAYLNIYLRNHPYVYSDRMIMVRILQPTPTGFPMQIFAYLTTADWPAYEGITADIFEHIAAIAPTFGLAVFEQPSGRSVFNASTPNSPQAPYFGTDPVTTVSPLPDTHELKNK